MPSHRFGSLIVLACLVLAALPGTTCAGDRPICVVGEWGIGEIDGRIMFYLGKGRYLDTPIPAPPHGPRWNVVYKAFPFVVVGVVGVWLYRRRHNPT